VVDYYKSKIQKLYVRYSPAIGRPSPTPFYKGQQKVLLENFRNSFNIPNGGVLSFKMPGNYLIQTDTTKREGLWVNVFSDGFPFPSTESDYLNPLVYLISEQEYLSMSQSENKKKAIDEFWNKCAVDADKGPLLADEYYKRVKESNDNFTTSKEGWKTDRGMVYILYGKPDMVSKESWGESWTYNAHYPYAAVEFRFTRSEQAWGYDYTLMREAHYKNLWYQAIDNWRNGRTKGR
jgi:GWxTD domain-containing protein